MQLQCWLYCRPCSTGPKPLSCCVMLMFWELMQGYGQIGARMGAFQGLNQARTQQQQGGQLEPQLPEARQQGFAPASQNMAMLSGFQVTLAAPVFINAPAGRMLLASVMC